MLGLRPIQEFTHSVEGILKQSPEGLPAGTLDALVAGASALRRAVARAGTPEEDEAFQALTPLRPGAPAPGAKPARRKAPPRKGPPGKVLPAAETGAPRAQDLRADTLRIPFRKLDTLLSQIGEVTTALHALEEWEARHRPVLREAGLRRSLVERLEVLDAATAGVRRSATDLRLVPVGRLFARFPALVRDLARAQEKRVRVVLEGEETQLDKSTVDALGEPLLHLVRNAVDHGIEPPEEREAAGKDPEATLRLRAEQEGDRVRIEVEDNGRGLDRKAIVARARKEGLLAPGEAPTPEEAAELIFRPGLTTRRRVSQVSGRGVGLDVVRSTVARLRGSVEVRDGAEGGTCFVLRLPLTVALVPVLFFEAAGERLAVPAAGVEEIVRSPGTERVGAAEVVRLREEVIPVARPGRIFGWEDGGPPPFLLILRHATRAVALAADRLREQHPATVRSLPPALGGPRGVSGATVAPDGRVVLLLDPDQLIQMNVDLYRGGGVGG